MGTIGALGSAYDQAIGHWNRCEDLTPFVWARFDPMQQAVEIGIVDEIRVRI